MSSAIIRLTITALLCAGQSLAVRADQDRAIPSDRLASLMTLPPRHTAQFSHLEAPPYALELPRTVEFPALSKNRMVVWGGLTATASYLAYEQSQASWGLSNGQFHFKDDLHDGLAMSDETSHLFAAYHLTRALRTGYSWTGLSPTASRRMAAAHAWLWTFLVEYPIDAFNPTQGFGASDLVFNTAGVLAAYQQTGPGPRPWWDIKISVKESFFRGESRFIAHSNEQYDDYIYWLTVRPTRKRFIPLWIGAGYSTTHGEWPQMDKELHLAIGTTVEDLAAMIDEDAGRYLRPLNFFFLNFGTKVVWK